MSQHTARHVPRLAVYTALVGGDGVLHEEPLAGESSADFLCFTDDPAVRSDTWQVIRVEPRLPTDPVRSERYLKIMGHPALAGYDRSLWVDSAVELTALPESFVDTWLEQADLAAPLHTFYPSVLAEAEASINLAKDDHLRVIEQLTHYVRAAPAAMDANPHWTALLARRRTAEVDAAMTTWWEHVLRFSRRDQLSFAVALEGSGLRLRSVPLGNLRSPLHHWAGGWETRAGEGSGSPQPDQKGYPRPGGRHSADPALVRAEIEEVLGFDRDEDRWIRDLEARLAKATAQVRRQRERLQGERES
jgi:hypothetical protein